MQHILAASIMIFFVCASPAQTAGPSDSPEDVKALLQEIRELKARVAVLEAREQQREQAAQSKPNPAAQAKPPEAPSPEPQSAGQSRELGIFPGIKMAGFTAVSYKATDARPPEAGMVGFRDNANNSFAVGDFDLFLTSHLTSKAMVLGEVVFSETSEQEFEVDVERLLLKYDFKDYFKLSFGRYHTPINYWNTAFHHGQWLQTSISRPEMTQFGGSFIPVHFVGTLVEGEAPASGLNLNYNFGLGNGRGAVISRPGDFGDVNNNRAWLANIFVKPDHPYGLRVGGSVYRDELNPLIAPAAREWIQSANVVWDKETPEIIAEFANVTHTPIQGGVTSNSQAYYVQTAYRLPFLQKLWKPYSRFEYIHVPKSDPIFRSVVPSFSGWTFGLRYDISSFAAFKWEYRRYDRRDLPIINGAFIQTSFTF